MQGFRSTTSRRAAALTMALVSASAAATAEGMGTPASPDQLTLVRPVYQPQQTFGPSTVVQTVRVEELFPASSSVTWASVINSTSIYRYQTSPPSAGDWWGPVFVPSGAILDELEMEACDTTATGQIVFGISRQVAPQGPSGNISATATTGSAATPGCAFFRVPVFTPLPPVDNRTNSYTIYMNFVANTTPETRVSAFRLFYRLQVSPAPALATFPNDVPTSHPAFRFVEALAAAGITGGCGAGAFCPDAPLTRAQMAVFLSVALGLHFPN